MDAMRLFLLGTRLPTILATLALVVFMNACSSLGIGYTKINDILQSPGKYGAGTVRIKGQVINATRLPFVDLRFYKVRDDTGEIPVLTNGMLPDSGSEVKVEGRLDTVATLNGTNFGLHLKEIRRW